ncbi:MAG TPA: hypothetical protein VF796_03520, partial [Humisphaera sp.]
MRRRNLLVILPLSAALASAPLLAARGGRGGPGGGRGFGGGPGTMQDWMKSWQQAREQQKKDQEKRSKEESERKQREKVAKYLDEGWSSLKAGDTAAATDAFTDALEIKQDDAEARLGLGLSKAADGQWAQAEKNFVLATRGELPKVDQPKPKPAT